MYTSNFVEVSCFMGTIILAVEKVYTKNYPFDSDYNSHGRDV